MHPRTTDLSRQQTLIKAVEREVARDSRIRAAWLAGSLVEGTADPWSDLDLYVAVTDEALDDFAHGALDWIGRIQKPHGKLLGTFGATTMFGVTLDSGIRLDLFVEPLSRVSEGIRPSQPYFLVDREDVTAKIRVGESPTTNARGQVERLIDGFFFGFTWHARLSGREEWGSHLLNALMVVYQFVVPAMLARSRPEHAYRPPLHNERFLPDSERHEVDTLVGELTAAFTPLGDSQPDGERIRAAHSRLGSTVLRELQAACKATGAQWPEDAERAMRAFYREEFGIDLN